VQIRESTINDYDFIRKVHEDAFGEPEGKTVSRLAIDLLADKSALPLLSLVAINNETIIGHILFSAVKVDGIKTPEAYILCPLAVAKAFQGKGIGTSLINYGLGILKERGAEFILVLGDPDYYSRTGFHCCHELKAPYELEHPEAWMALELTVGSLTKYKGLVQCADSLNSPIHW
jgi:putative acetyltransferase